MWQWWWKNLLVWARPTDRRMPGRAGRGSLGAWNIFYLFFKYKYTVIIHYLYSTYTVILAVARLALEIWILNFNCWYQYDLCYVACFRFINSTNTYKYKISIIEYATKIYKIQEYCLILFAKWCQKWSPFNVGYGIKVVKVTPAQCDVVNHHHRHGFMVDSNHKSFGLHYIVFCY